MNTNARSGTQRVAAHSTKRRSSGLLPALATPKQSVAYQKERQKLRRQSVGSAIESESYRSQTLDISKLLEFNDFSIKNSKMSNISDSWSGKNMKSKGSSKRKINNGNQLNQGMLDPNSTIRRVNYDWNGMNMNSKGNDWKSMQTGSSDISHTVTMNTASEFCIVFALFCFFFLFWFHLFF